jgi:hypothetical protein
LFLLLFKQKKKNKEEFILDSVLKFQNELFDLIFWVLEYDKYKDVYDTYDDENDDIDIDTDNLEIPIEENVNNTNNMKIISLWQRIFDKINVNENTNKVLTEINLIIDDFQPFNNIDLDVCEKIYYKDNTPIILVQINNNKSYKPISKDTSKMMLTNIVKEYDMFKAFLISNKNSLENIIEDLSDYKIKTVFTTQKYIDYFKKQNIIYEYDFNYEKIIYSNEYIIKDMIDKIKNDELLFYKKNVPECIHNLYEIIKKDIKK